MEQCPFCKASVSANATFCNNCGRTFDQSAAQATAASEASTLRPPETTDSNSEKTLVTGQNSDPATPLPGDPNTPSPEGQSVEDEAHRKRSAATFVLSC